jgi:hypothetical protein
MPKFESLGKLPTPREYFQYPSTFEGTLMQKENGKIALVSQQMGQDIELLVFAPPVESPRQTASGPSWEWLTQHLGKEVVYHEYVSDTRIAKKTVIFKVKGSEEQKTFS